MISLAMAWVRSRGIPCNPRAYFGDRTLFMSTIGRQLHTWIHTTTRYSVGNACKPKNSHGRRTITKSVTRYSHRTSISLLPKPHYRVSIIGPSSRSIVEDTAYTYRNSYQGGGRRTFTNLVTTDAQRQTIYALSTPPGKGGVAIVRVSGPDALKVWKRMLRSHSSDKLLRDPIPWKLQRCRIVHPDNETLIDDGLAVYFRGVSIPGYYTV